MVTCILLVSGMGLSLMWSFARQYPDMLVISDASGS